MKQTMRDERAVRGAAELAAGMYRWALIVLAGVGVLDGLMWMAGRITWHPLLLEALALTAGVAVVLAQRIRLGLWGGMDDAMRELLHIARAKGFRWMFWLTAAGMLLGMLLDHANAALYQLPGLTLALLRSHVLTQCRQNGWLHGLTERPPEGKRALLRGLLTAVAFTAFVLGAGWFIEKKPPETGDVVFVLVFAALVFVSGAYGRRKEYRDSEQAADMVLRGAEARASREEKDDEETENAGG